MKTNREWLNELPQTHQMVVKKVLPNMDTECNSMSEMLHSIPQAQTFSEESYSISTEEKRFWHELVSYYMNLEEGWGFDDVMPEVPAKMEAHYELKYTSIPFEVAEDALKNVGCVIVFSDGSVGAIGVIENAGVRILWPEDGGQDFLSFDNALNDFYSVECLSLDDFFGAYRKKVTEWPDHEFPKNIWKHDYFKSVLPINA